jgi:hypothetical protein
MLKVTKKNHENVFYVMIWSEYNKERIFLKIIKHCNMRFKTSKGILVFKRFFMHDIF